jgi:hypothetical protein
VAQVSVGATRDIPNVKLTNLVMVLTGAMSAFTHLQAMTALVSIATMLTFMVGVTTSETVVIAPIESSDLCGYWTDPGLTSSFKCTYIDECSIWQGER